MLRNVLTPPDRLLLGPGPSNPHPAVQAAAAAPMVGHLDPFFLQTMEETMDGLRSLYRTANHHTIPVSGTGSAGLELLMMNLLEPGDRAVVGVIGHFGERLAELARRAGAEVEGLEAPWGEAIAPERVEAALRAARTKVVALVHAETSTGVHQPLEDLARLTRKHDALLVADCVTSFGGMPVEVDGWGVDAAGSCSQKCIGAPPGLGPVTLGPRALAAIRARTTPVRSWYLDVELLFTYWGERGQGGQGRQRGARAFHHTAPVSAIYAFREALRLIHEEGLEPRFARHRSAHERLAAGLDRLGLEFFTPADLRLPMLNVIRIPEGVDDADVRARLLERGIEIGGGFGPLKGKVWRVGLMGVNAAAGPVDALLGALEEVLAPAAPRSVGGWRSP